MKLSYTKNNEYRKQIEELLQYVPDGQRIHIEKEFLEELLFEKEILCGTDDENEKKIAKLPVWSGPFLRKIDLSEVSFKDVCWSAEFYLPLGIWKEKYEKYLSNVDYSYTNAKINFSDSFYATHHGYRSIYIQYCNFEGANLSNNKFNNELFELYLSNISNTNICLKDTGKIVFTDSIVSNVDLSWVNVKLEDLFDEDNIIKLDTNYLNTGLQIVGNVDDLDECNKLMFNCFLNSGKLNGCYINGEVINIPIKEHNLKLVRKLK